MSPEAQHFIDLLAPYIDSYGYWVAFFGMMVENAGIPVPAETSLIILSFFASQGVLKIWLIIPIAIIGDTAGDNIGYAIGRFGGRPLVDRYGKYIRLDPEKLDRMEKLFREKGGRTVYFAHFLASTRITAALTAGMAHMRYPQVSHGQCRRGRSLRHPGRRDHLLFRQQYRRRPEVFPDLSLGGALCPCLNRGLVPLSLL